MDNPVSEKYYQQYLMMLEWVDMYLNKLTDEDLKTEISEGKNHGIWILGHLIVSDDELSVFLGKGEALYPELQEKFGQGSRLMPPENYPAAQELREKWITVCEKNRKIYNDLKDKEFEEPHAMINDIEKDYFKNKGRVIMAWQLHQVYHAGQLAVLLSKSGKQPF